MPGRVGRLLGLVGPQRIGEFPFQGPVTYYLFEQMDVMTRDTSEYMTIAAGYVPSFEANERFSLVAGGMAKPDNQQDRCRITHLWKMRDGQTLEKVMVDLCNDSEYGKIDRLVGRTRFECQDIAINFGETHGGPDAPTPLPDFKFKYVLAQHQLWTTGLNTFAWEFDFDAGYPGFIRRNPGWIHLGNRMKITGAIYDVFELWIAPERGDPEAILLSAPWNKTRPWDAGKPIISLLTPTVYDHNGQNVHAKG